MGETKRYSGITGVGGLTADTIEWCPLCWLADPKIPKEKISNYGGECCLWKKKRASGKMCDYWIRKKEP